jgi:hypothetical protein
MICTPEEQNMPIYVQTVTGARERRVYAPSYFRLLDNDSEPFWRNELRRNYKNKSARPEYIFQKLLSAILITFSGLLSF